MSTLRAPALAVLLLAAAWACARSGERGAEQAPPRPHYLEGVPLIPQSLITDTLGSPDAEHRGLAMQLPMDSVVSFYRHELPARGWHVMGGTSDTGQVSMLLEKDSVSLWVLIRRIGPLATQYSLTAARKGGT